MSFRVIDEKEVPDADRVSNDRPDFTTEQVVNVDVTVQTERLEALVQRSTTLIASEAANAYNTGWIEIGDFNKFIGTVFSDQNLTIYLEQSTDEENLDSQITQAYTGGAYDGVFSLELTSPYVRLRVVAAANTAAFRVWSRLSMGA